MRKVVILCALIELVPSYGISQEATADPALDKTKQPMFLTGIARNLLKSTNSDELAPLTRQERLRLYLSQTYGPGSTFRAAAAAGVQQWINKPGEWNQGAEGYRKRLASTYGTHVIHGTIVHGVSAILREDNRYRRSLETGWRRRAMHAATGAFSSTDAAGNRHFSYSHVGGIAATAYIRGTWQPHSMGGVGHDTAAAAIGLGAGVGKNLFREFWPDIKRRFLK